MSIYTFSVRTEKLRVDRAVGRVYAQHRRESAFLRAFDELLLAARRTPLFTPVLRPAEHDPVEALANLARFQREFLRQPAHWRPRGRSVIELVESLAAHLLAHYPTPRFLASVWFGPDDKAHRARRRWFVAHARGAPFRHGGLPLAMTRRMEHHFLHSPDHLGVIAAMRRAEVLALGGSRELADAVARMRLAHDTAHAEFWSSVLGSLARHEAELGARRTGAIVEALHELRHEPVELRSGNGRSSWAPRAPRLSLKGRSPASLLRLVSDFAGDPTCAWRPSGLRGLVYEEERDGLTPARWCLVELRDGRQLAAEGQALRHCVRQYASECRAGRASIWSIRRLLTSGATRPVLTLEVDPRRRDVVQARGRHNRQLASTDRGPARRVLELWTAREGLTRSLARNALP